MGLIELAPGHKQGLPVDNPVLLAGGVVGYGEAVPPGLEMSALGAVVIGPFTATPRRGSAPPRMATTNGGLVLATGGQSRGVRAAVRQFARLWPRLGVPVVAQIIDTDAVAAGRTAAALARCAGIVGLELAPPLDDADGLEEAIRAVIDAADLPLWVKLPVDGAAQLARGAVRAGAQGLVIGRAPSARLPGAEEAKDGRAAWVSGALHGPLVFAMMMKALTEVAQQELGVPLIACGGIHTAEQMAQALAAGASAIQVDSGVWVEPALPNWLATDWSRSR